MIYNFAFSKGVSSGSRLVFGGVVGDFLRILPWEWSPSDIHHHFVSIFLSDQNPDMTFPEIMDG